MAPSKIFEDEHVEIILADGLLHIAFLKTVPDEQLGIPLARAVTANLARELSDVPDRSLQILIDVTRVQRTAPRANAIFMDWVKRDWRLFRVVAFATNNVLLRSSLKVASLLPGININGFPTVEEAREFLSSERRTHDRKAVGA